MSSSDTVWNKTTTENTSTRMDRGQDNRDLGDMSQQHGTTLDTVLAIFNRLRYYMENGAKTNTQSGAVDTKNELKASTQLLQEKGDLGDMAEQHGTTLGTASAILNRLGYDTDTPERDTPPKQGEKDSWYTVSGVAIDKQRGSPMGMTQPVPAAVSGNRAVTRPASADTWR